MSTANWTTTSANSFPPSAATTIGTVTALLNAGGQDPHLMLNGVMLDADNIKTLTDDDLQNITLSSSSPLIARGAAPVTDSVDFYGIAFKTPPCIGPYQVSGIGRGAVRGRPSIGRSIRS